MGSNSSVSSFPTSGSWQSSARSSSKSESESSSFCVPLAYRLPCLRVLPGSLADLTFLLIEAAIFPALSNMSSSRESRDARAMADVNERRCSNERRRAPKGMAFRRCGGRSHPPLTCVGPRCKKGPRQISSRETDTRKTLLHASKKRNEILRPLGSKTSRVPTRRLPTPPTFTLQW